jgi:hypothetical protein
MPDTYLDTYLCLTPISDTYLDTYLTLNKVFLSLSHASPP